MKQCPKCLSFDVKIIRGGLFYMYMMIKCTGCGKRTDKYYYVDPKSIDDITTKAIEEWNGFERGIFVCR